MYDVPKGTLAFTGAGGIGVLAYTEQWLILGGALVAVGILLLAVRFGFRRGRGISDS